MTGIDQAVFPEAERMDSTPTDSMADAIGDAIESYLKTRSKQKPASEQRLPGSTGDDANSEGVEDGAGVSRPRPRHRAPNVWELDRLPEEPDEPPFKEGPVDEGGA